MPALRPISPANLPSPVDRPFRDQGAAQEAMALGPGQLVASAAPLLAWKQEGATNRMLNELRPTQAQFESVRNSLTNEIALTANNTVADDYAQMRPRVEHLVKGEWVEDEDVTEQWELFARNDIQDHSEWRRTFAHHILGAGQSFLYLANSVKSSRGPQTQWITPLALLGKQDNNGFMRVFVHIDDDSKNDAEIDPKRVMNVWTGNPLTSLSGWSGAKTFPWTWLMNVQDKFETLRLLGRALDSMAVNRFLQNGILWFESHDQALRANPVMPGSAWPGSSPAFTGPNAGGRQGGPFQASAGHASLVSAQTQNNEQEAATFLAVLDKAYREPKSAAARSPFPVYWPKKPEFVLPDFKFDQHRLEEEREATIKIARACPMPFDFVLSSGSESSHWSRKNMREETIEISVQWAQKFDALITQSLFARFFEVAGLNPDEWRLTSDPSKISVKPDITEAVKYGHEAGIVSDEGFLEASNIPEDMWTEGVKGSGKNSVKEAAAQAAKAAQDTAKAAEAAKPAPAPAKAEKPPVDESGKTTPDPAADLKASAARLASQLEALQAAGLVPFPDEVAAWNA